MLDKVWFWGLVIAVAAIAYLALRRGRATGVPEAGGGPLAPRRAPRAAGSPKSSERPALADVESWGYQLQDLDIARAAASPFDLLVVDYTRDGSEETRLTRGEIERLQRKPDGSRRLVLAYVSIGEAESYRPYWNAAWKRQRPEWLLKENRDWPENYAVCFWHPEWQQLMCGSDSAYLDRVQAQGFDGVYLDKCDVFEDLQAHERAVAKARPGMQEDMVAFVRSISTHLKVRDPGFLVVMQNAEVLLNHADLVAAIDGVAKEELIYGVDGPEKPNGEDEIVWSKTCLERARTAGKAVLVVEYLKAPDKIARAAKLTSEFGYVLYVAPKDRELKRLNYDVLEA